jgi:hypothetical protein
MTKINLSPINMSRAAELRIICKRYRMHPLNTLLPPLLGVAMQCDNGPDFND